MNALTIWTAISVPGACAFERTRQAAGQDEAVTSPSGSGWFDVADPIVKGIVRKKLRVSLSERDDRRENQDAFDVVQGIYEEIAKALAPPGARVGDLTVYAAVVAYHACAQYLRAKYPARTRLKNKIRYFLTHEPGFALWETKDGDLHCGYAGWKAKEPSRTEPKAPPTDKAVG